MFAIGQKSKVPDLPIVVMQMLGMIMIVFFSFLYDRQSISKTLLLIVLFQLICCYGLRFFNIEYFENPLGFDPQDAMGYHQHGSHIEKSFIAYLRYLDSIVQLDDYGFQYVYVPIMCDNKSTINLSKNPIQHFRTKHIKIKHLFIRDHVAKGDISLNFINTNEQWSDIFTKPFNEQKFYKIRHELGMCYN